MCVPASCKPAQGLTDTVFRDAILFGRGLGVSDRGWQRGRRPLFLGVTSDDSERAAVVRCECTLNGCFERDLVPDLRESLVVGLVGLEAWWAGWLTGLGWACVCSMKMTQRDLPTLCNLVEVLCYYR